MSSTTTNLGLYKPAAGENVNVTTDLNNNWDTIDAQYGAWTAFSLATSQIGSPTTLKARARKIGKTNYVSATVQLNGVGGGGATEFIVPVGMEAHSSMLSGGRDVAGLAQATDTSTGLTMLGFCYFGSDNRHILFRSSQQQDVWGVSSLPFIWASGDLISCNLTYELA